MLNSVMPKRRTFLWPKISPSLPPAIKKPSNYTQVGISCMTTKLLKLINAYRQRISRQNPLQRSFIVAKCLLNGRKGDVRHAQICNINKENEASTWCILSGDHPLAIGPIHVHYGQGRKQRGSIQRAGGHGGISMLR